MHQVFNQMPKKVFHLCGKKLGQSKKFYYKQNTVIFRVLAQYGNHLILPKNSLFPTFNKKAIVYSCGVIDPKNYTNLKQFIEACQQKMNVGLEEAKKIYANSTKKRNIRL